MSDAANLLSAATPLSASALLSASLLSASSPPAATAATSSLLAFLARHHPDPPRAFFSDAFPSILFRLFVSSPSSPSFLDLAASAPHSSLANLLLSLLSPSGPLLLAAASADRRALIRFVFPSERLPCWLRVALASAPDSSDLVSPLLAARVASDLHLSVFEYYLFWFAYYPVSSSTSPTTSNPALKSRSRLESWVSTLAPIRKPGHRPEPSLYLKLLHAYLREFVPTACTPLRRLAGTLLQRTASEEATDAADPSARAEFFLHTLVQFWLVGDDFSPLPVHTRRAFGLQLPSRARAELTERPPSPSLGDAVKLLVMYLNCCVGGPPVDTRMVFEGMTVRNVVCDSQVGFWNPLIQRPMYRFVLRAFLFCPMGAVIKNATQVFSVWLAYMEPWKVTQEELDEYDVSPMHGQETQLAGEGKERQKRELLYTPQWKNYVLSNYLFYSSMVVHFLGFAHKFIHSDVTSVLLMILKVLEVLSSSTELVDLLYKVDIAYHSRLVTSSSCSSDDVLQYLPSIREQLKDWEDGLSETDADGSFLHEHWNSDLRLFNCGEDGAYHLLQLLMIRAESEIQRLSDTLQALQTLDFIKSHMKKVFQGRIEGMHRNTSPEESQHQHHGRGEIFTPKHPHSGKSKLAEVKYRGDWMKRPISETEVAWLASILIRLSDRLNDTLRLDCDDVYDNPANPSYIKFDRSELTTVGGPKDAARMALLAVCSLLVLVGQALLKFMRAHRVKINLRFLASKKLLAGIVVLYAAVAATRNALR